MSSFGKRASSKDRIPAVLIAVGIAVACLTAIPVVYLLLRTLGMDWAAITDAFTSDIGELIFRTLSLGIAVTISSVVLGVAAAWVTSRTDLPMRKLWALLLALPLVLPSYLAGFAFISALGPRGALQKWLEPLGVNRVASIYGFFGAWLVLTLITYPYVMLTVRSALMGLDPSLDEAAASLGDSSAARARRIVLPQLRPSIIAGALLVMLYVIHDFGAVSLMRYNTFTRAIYTSYQGSFDRDRAALLSLTLLAMALIIVSLEARTRRKVSYHRVHSGSRKAPYFEPLGIWKVPALATCVFVVGLAVVLPLVVCCYWLVVGLRSGNAQLTAPLAAGWGSFLASGTGTAVCLLAAFPVALLTARYRGRVSTVVGRIVYSGYALPGVVVALSLVFFGTRAAPWMYQTLGMLAFAYLLLFLPQAVGAIHSSLVQVNPSIFEAALTLGRNRAQAIGKVLFPLSRPGLAAGGALVFLTIMKELPATLILAPPGFSTLATRVWGATAAASFSAAAVPAILLLLLSVVPLGAMLALGPRFEPGQVGGRRGILSGNPKG